MAERSEKAGKEKGQQQQKGSSHGSSSSFVAVNVRMTTLPHTNNNGCLDLYCKLTAHVFLFFYCCKQ